MGHGFIIRVISVDPFPAMVVQFQHRLSILAYRIAEY